MESEVKFSPIFGDEDKLPDWELKPDGDKIKLNGNSIKVPECDIYDMINLAKKPFNLTNLHTYLKLLNLDKMTYLNVINDSIVTKGISSNDSKLKLVSDGHVFDMTNTDYSELINELLDNSRLIDEVSTSISELNNSIEKTEDRVHQIHDNYNVSDYIIFSDCKTRGIATKEFVSSDLVKVNYNIDLDNRATKYESGSVCYEFETYKKVLHNTDNITDSNYGTYIELTITFKLNGEVHTVPKLVQLYDDLEISYIQFEYLSTDITSIKWDDLDIVYTDSLGMHPLNTVDNHNAYNTLFEVVFDKKKLIIYCKNQDITEYYVSSCLVHKVDRLIGDGID